MKLFCCQTAALFISLFNILFHDYDDVDANDDVEDEGEGRNQKHQIYNF
jgi:hypothetical protein